MKGKEWRRGKEGGGEEKSKIPRRIAIYGGC